MMATFVGLGVGAAIVCAMRWPQTLFWVVIGAAPFQIALNPASGIDLLMLRALVPLLFVGWLFVRWRHNQRIVLSPITMGMTVLAALGSLSALWATDAGIAFTRSLVWWSLLPVAVMGETLFGQVASRETYMKLLPWVVGGVSVVALIPVVAPMVTTVGRITDIIQALAPRLWGQDFGAQVVAHQSWLVSIQETTVVRAFLPFPDPHTLAFFFALTLPFLVVRRRQGCRYKAALGVGIIAFLATFSRGGYVALLLTAILGGIIQWRQRWARWLLVGIAAAVVLVLLIPNPVGTRLQSTTRLTEGSITERLHIMKRTTRVVADHSVQGVGFGHLASTLEPTAPREAPVYAHNSYLDVAAELGVPALILMIVIGGMAVVPGLRDAPTTLAYTAALTVIWFGLHALTDTPLFSPRVLPFLFLALALLAQHYRS